MTNQNCWNCSQILCGKVYTVTNGDGCPYWIEHKEDILEDIDVFGSKLRIRKFGRIKRRKHKYIPFYFIR